MNYVDFLRSYDVKPSRNWVNNLIIRLYNEGYFFESIEEIILMYKFHYGWKVCSEYHISERTKNVLIKDKKEVCYGMSVL